MRDITQLHPELQEKLQKTINDCKAAGITIKISECLRTVAEQEALYAQGRTKPGNIVTNARGTSYSSQHQWGIAADFFLAMDVDGDGSTADDSYNDKTGLFGKVGKIAKQNGLGWGGDWKSPVDKPHLYLPHWGSTTTQLKNKYGTPEKFMAKWPKKTTTVSTAKGPDEKIKTIQKWCNTYCNAGLTVDGYYGPKTRKGLTKALQRYLNKVSLVNLVLDGVWGRKTKDACVTATDKGDHVYIAQAALYCHGYDPGALDGIDGKKTQTAAKAFQKDKGLTADGIVGKNTFEKLLTT
ncbi:MAG: peptidoglycan-binding protein [Bacteroidaceae bacterium]|nr:peptidoglycan-binding protein [Bacteroidaceae bacterium]